MDDKETAEREAAIETEIEAVRAICLALDPLTPDAQVRVIAAVAILYGIASPAPIFRQSAGRGLNAHSRQAWRDSPEKRVRNRD